MIDFLREIRYAFRLLTRDAAHSLVIIAVLAFGIAANVITFSLFKALWLAPLAGVPDSRSLYYVGATTSGGQLSPLSFRDYEYLRDHAYADLASWSAQPVILGRASHGQRAFAEFVSGNYFHTLGVSTQLGRPLQRSDEAARSASPVTVLSDGLWRRAFGADPGVIGRTILVNARPATIVGVTHPDFRSAIVGLATDLFIPVTTHPQLTGLNWLDSDNRNVHAFMRLPSGVNHARAEAHVAQMSGELAKSRPMDWQGERATLVPIGKWPYGAQTYMSPAVTVVGTMAALLLIGVCANVAGLVLVRSIHRRGEIAARFALGATRGQIVRQLTIESLVLAMPGALVGFLLPQYAEPFLGGAAASVPLPLYFNVEPDRFVVVFTLALGSLCAFAYGLGPALRLSRVDPASVMKGHLPPQARSTSLLRTWLVVSQIAVSLTLLVGTGLAVQMLDDARRADLGFEADAVTWATVPLQAATHDEQSGRVGYQQLLDAVRASPSVDAAALAVSLPLTLFDWQNSNFEPEGYQRRRDEDLTFALNIVSPDYFRTLRIPVVSGREFDRRDTDASRPVAVINETFARRFWGNTEAAVGRRVRTDHKWLTIVGVARDIKYARLDEAPRPYVYLPFTQVHAPVMTLQVRTAVDVSSTIALIRAAAEQVDASLPIVESGLLTDQTRSAVALFETVARILGAIGLIAAGLAGVGVYGLVAYTVRTRTHEIGIRTAMGATSHEVTRRFVAVGATLGSIGIALGFIVAAALNGIMRASGLVLAPPNVVSFVAAAGVMFGVAIAASFIPAWRAARLDPAVGLRQQ
ncbi:MAG: ABC transporter permease [Vicinamibacterales bacterium]